MKKILGLDLGTNSIGWALIERDFEKAEGEIDGLGSRIIPMEPEMFSRFGTGLPLSKSNTGIAYTPSGKRTDYRGVRRLFQRDNLRRERLHRVLNILGFLPKHYANTIDFAEHFGQFKKDTEVKLNYRKNKLEKYEFIFMDSFNEMVKEFEAEGQETKIPYDWTLYYLRKKALSKKITKEELAWIILNFNQKRGYYLRGEEKEISDGKKKEFVVLKVKGVTDSGEVIKKSGDKLYDVVFENGWSYDKQITKTENWIDRTKEFIVTTTIKKDGEIKRTFKAVNSEEDWIAIKTKTQQDIDTSGKYICEYIYNALLLNPTQKIRGKLIKTIEREYYKKEFKAILKEQIKHHTEINVRTVVGKKLYQSCVDELYPRNEAHQNNIKDKDFTYLFTDDIIFYQRPLKSKKSTISGCQYETRRFKKKVIDKVTNEEKEEWLTEPIKAIPKSHPLFQEFRLWQFLKNLKVYKKEDAKGNLIDKDITSELLQTEDDWVSLFDFLNERKTIKQNHIIDFFIKKKSIDKKQKSNFYWNYVEDKEYPANDTKASFISRLKKVKDLNAIAFLTPKTEYKLWHIIYSVTDKNEFEQAITNFAIRNNIDQKSFEDNFKKFPPFKSDYGAYSEKAIKKLLPLMRRGKYWDEDNISQEVKNRISNIKDRLESIDYDIEVFKTDKNKRLQTIVDDDVPEQLLKSFVEFKNQNHLAGLNTYQACYAVYERHSEASTITQWKTPDDIDKFLRGFKQHSLRNPIVEQVVTETLRIVRDIWQYYGNGKEKFFSEIHVELGREMKNPAGKRESMAKKNIENENTNQRIKAVLHELMNDPEVDGDIKPFSPSQQEILKIYEEGVFQNPAVSYKNTKEDDIVKIRKNSTPSKTEITRYKLWLEQGYVSPYTGKMIPLNRLFTEDYQIEHIIPQSRYFDNSLSNKIICESEVNALKDNQTGYDFIKNPKMKIVDLGQGRSVPLFSLEQYESHCNNYFKKNRTKLKNLLSEDIPKGFINRQLNDSRYISKLIKGLLGNLVREKNEREVTSKHLIPVTGTITSKLKQDWGLNDKWNELIAPRFERINKLITKEGESLSKDFGYWENQNGKKFFRTQVPDEISKGFSKKRIDHRHHALDALVIACCTREHTHYLNALNSENKNYGLRNSLLKKNDNGDYTKHFLMPWRNFTTNTKSQLEKTVVSFKQNLRVINKTNNKTWQWKEVDGQLKKKLIKQEKGDNWSIRKPMHKETISGRVFIDEFKRISIYTALKNHTLIIDKKIRDIIIVKKKDFNNKELVAYFKKNPIKQNGIKITKVKVWVKATATRIALCNKFTRKQLESITDTGIQRILENHLKNYIDEKGKEQFDLAFNTEGVDELNKNILKLNNGKKHQPIYKVRIYEVGKKFNVGLKGSRESKFAEAAKGTNLFFAIYWNDEKQKREYETIPLNEVIEHQKWRATLGKEERNNTPLIPIKPEKGVFLFTLSPNDLVYVPTDEELENQALVNFDNLSKEQTNSIYKMVSTTKGECHFIPNSNATEIIKNENGTNSKSERVQNFYNQSVVLGTDNKPVMIKTRCWKLKADRLGNIVKDW